MFPYTWIPRVQTSRAVAFSEPTFRLCSIDPSVLPLRAYNTVFMVFSSILLLTAVSADRDSFLWAVHPLLQHQAPSLFCMTVPLAQYDVACLGCVFAHSTLSITRKGWCWMITRVLLQDINWAWQGVHLPKLKPTWGKHLPCGFVSTFSHNLLNCVIWVLYL